MTIARLGVHEHVLAPSPQVWRGAKPATVTLLPCCADMSTKRQTSNRDNPALLRGHVSESPTHGDLLHRESSPRTPLAGCEGRSQQADGMPLDDEFRPQSLRRASL